MEFHIKEAESEIKIEIIRGMRGKYGWRIGYRDSSNDINKILNSILEIDEKLRKHFQI